MIVDSRCAVVPGACDTEILATCCDLPGAQFKLEWQRCTASTYIVGMLQLLRRAFFSPLSWDFVNDVSCMEGGVSILRLKLSTRYVSRMKTEASSQNQDQIVLPTTAISSNGGFHIVLGRLKSSYLPMCPYHRKCIWDDVLPSGNLRANKLQNRRTALGRQLRHRLWRQGPAERVKMRQTIHMAPVLSDMRKAPAIYSALLVTGCKRTVTAHARPEVH